MADARVNIVLRVLAPRWPRLRLFICRRSTAWLLAAVIFAAGFFIGAIGFGCALISQHAP